MKIIINLISAKKLCGFTLMEMMVVLAIICILAVFMLPVPQENQLRKQIAESVGLIENYKKQLELYYQVEQAFPKDNADAKLPKPEHLIGNFVKKIQFNNGAFHIYFGSKAHTGLKDKIISVRPIIVKDSPASPISWVCGFSPAPEGMIAVGDNLTNIDRKSLPIGCR